VPQDLKDMDLSDYDLIVFYNPSDVKSLYENFPDFKQGDIKFVSYGKSIVKAMQDAGLTIDVQAPTPEAPSVARAIELYLEKQR
jgi:uroporphyrinogen-III synthase